MIFSSRAFVAFYREAAGGQEDLVAELAFDPTWITNSNADAHDPELASIMTLHMDNG